MPHLLSVGDLDRTTVASLLGAARELAKGERRASLVGSLVALLFFEDSVRTRIGFEAAVARCGGRTFALAATKYGSSQLSPESLADTLRSVGGWCDALCIRDADASSARLAAAVTDVPVINCGNGSEEHPTQAMVDLFAIETLLGGVDGLSIAIVGDLDGMRSAHSLILALSLFRGVRVRCVAPPGLGIPARYSQPFIAAGNSMTETSSPRYDDVDVVYVAGIPTTTGRGVLPQETRDVYRVDAAAVETLAPGSIILCPLPRMDEIAPEVDDSEHAAYFRQSALGLPMRTSLLEHVLRHPD